jgi:hypothetical protein
VDDGGEVPTMRIEPLDGQTTPHPSHRAFRRPVDPSRVFVRNIVP